MNTIFKKAADNIPAPDSEGMRLLYEYAGPAAARKYLDRFAEENPLLVKNLEDWACGYVLRDDTLDMQTKAAINAVALKAGGGEAAPSELKLHQDAYLRRNDNRAALATLMYLGDLLRTAKSTDEIIGARSDFYDRKTLHLCAIAGVAAAGMPLDTDGEENGTTKRRKQILKELFERALFDGTKATEIESTLFLVSAVRGFPIAIEAGRVFQEYLQDDLEYSPLPVPAGKEPAASPGLTTYMAYAGQETGEAFLKGFAQYNPKLARFTLDFPYRHITANDSAIPGFALKASIKVAMLYACNDAPAAMNLHSKANKRNNAEKKILSYYEVLGTALRDASDADSIRALRADYLESPEAFYLPVIAGLAAQGERKKPLLEKMIHHALDENIDKNKIRFTLNMVAVYRGFPAACAAAATLQTILRPPPAPQPPVYRPPVYRPPAQP